MQIWSKFYLVLQVKVYFADRHDVFVVFAVFCFCVITLFVPSYSLDGNYDANYFIISVNYCGDVPYSALVRIFGIYQ